MAPFWTSLQALDGAMWPRRRCNYMSDIDSMAFMDSDACMTLYRCPWVRGMQPMRSPCGDVSSRWPTPICAWYPSSLSAATDTRVQPTAGACSTPWRTSSLSESPFGTWMASVPCPMAGNRCWLAVFKKIRGVRGEYVVKSSL
jgi:hypothetical protein